MASRDPNRVSPIPPPAPPDEAADGRSCDAGNCNAPSTGWRYYPNGPHGWLPVCAHHLANKSLYANYRHPDPQEAL